MNESKTKICVFYHKPTTLIELVLNNVAIKSQKMNVIGILFGLTLCWTNQISQTVTKSKKALYAIRLLKKAAEGGNEDAISELNRIEVEEKTFEQFFQIITDEVTREIGEEIVLDRDCVKKVMKEIRDDSVTKVTEDTVREIVEELLKEKNNWWNRMMVF